MRFFGFGSKKRLDEREKELNAKAYEQVEKANFENLYLKLGNYNYKNDEFRTPEEAAQYYMEARVTDFMRNNAILSVIMANAAKWHEMYKDKADPTVLDALEELASKEYNIKNRRYVMRKMGEYYYPQSLIFEDEKKTKDHYLRWLEKLKKLN